MKATKVLQVLHNLKRGGVQADAMYLARLLDKSEVQMDILLLSDEIGEYESEFNLYGNIFRVPVYRGNNKISRFISFFKNPFIVYHKVYRFLKTNGQYDAIHVRHMLFIAPCLLAAKRVGVSVRIGHSHVNAPDNERLYVKLYLEICKWINSYASTIELGVTKCACEYIFNNSDKVHVIKNPTVDLGKFNYVQYTPDEHEGIELLQVGSFSTRKNQMFTLDVLNSMVKRGENTHLTLIGYSNSGSDIIEKLHNRINVLKIADKVSFLPHDTNVAQALAKCDYMILPSLQEGLPNAVLEAQAMGVTCFLSSNITTEADCGLCEFLSLREGPDVWADRIIRYAKSTNLQKQCVDMSSWDNRVVARQYLSLWRGESWSESIKVFHNQ